MRNLFGFCVSILLISPAAAQEKPAPKKPEKPRIPANAVPGYTVKKVEGFHLLVSDETSKHLDDAFERKPMEVLELELQGIGRVMPSPMLKLLKTIAIFVEWDDPESRRPGMSGTVVARYWYDTGNGLGMLQNGRNPLKANNVEILSMKYLTEKWQPGKSNEQIIILHELSHAVHNHLVGARNPGVQAAYQQAMDRKLYDEVRSSSGRLARAYAATNDHEYFAELSCAYLDRCAFYPFTREELKEHDPIGHKLMEQVWGKADNRILRAKTAAKVAAKPATKPEPPGGTAAPPTRDPEISAEQKLELIDILVQSGRKEKARERLQELIEAYPNTKAAKKAKDLLESLK